LACAQADRETLDHATSAIFSVPACCMAHVEIEHAFALVVFDVGRKHSRAATIMG
jgi:hypothetical protein